MELQDYLYFIQPYKDYGTFFCKCDYMIPVGQKCPECGITKYKAVLGRISLTCNVCYKEFKTYKRGPNINYCSQKCYRKQKQRLKKLSVTKYYGARTINL